MTLHSKSAESVTSAETTTTATTAKDISVAQHDNNSHAPTTTKQTTPLPSFVRSTIIPEINKQVLRRKLARQRHCVIEQGIQPQYLEELFPRLLDLFAPQTVHYNGGIAAVKDWKISCYLEVMPGGVPTTEPNVELLYLFHPFLEACNQLFCHWYRQQHACNNNNNNRTNKLSNVQCHRLMTFITRYTPAPGEQALLKHVDGAGKVDGSIVVALPIDRWSGGDHSFEGGGLTFWDGKTETGKPLETHYDTRSGDIAFIDRAVWHQADPITKGTRWALVIFYKVL